MAEKEDRWDGDEYLNRPGQLESARINAINIQAGLEAAGVPASLFKTMNIVEVGAGVGTVTQHLGPVFRSVLALEPSTNMLSVLARLTKGLDNVVYAEHALTPASAAAFEKGEPMSSPTESDPKRTVAPPHAKFDAAVSTLVAHHVDDLPAYFAGVRGVLKPNAPFLILEFAHGPNGEDLSRQFHCEEKPQLVPIDDDKHHISEWEFRTTWTPEHLKGLFEQNGFTDTGAFVGKPIPAFAGPKDRQPVPTMVVWGRAPK